MAQDDLWERLKRVDSQRSKPPFLRMIEKTFGSVRSFVSGMLTVAAVGSAFAGYNAFEARQEATLAETREMAREAREIAAKQGQDEINRKTLLLLQEQADALDIAEKRLALIERSNRK